MDIIDNIYQSSVNSMIYGMGNTTYNDINDFTRYQIEDILYNRNLNNIDIIELSICGSRINSNPHKDADLDVILYYKGNIKSYDLYKLLHKEEYIDQLTYDGVYIDIKPEQV